MSNLQYIGARYVPVVFDNPDDHTAEWKGGIGYENLVIVTYGGDSYTSRKPVPASVGNPANNTSYWTKTGDYNAAISALNSNVAALQTQNGNATLNTTAQTLSQAVNELDDDIKSINRFNSRTFIFIGDSYGGRQNSNGNTWGEIIQSYLGIPTIYTWFLNGGSFSGANGGLKFLNLITSHYNDVADHDAVTDIVVMGGANDYTNNTLDIENGIRDFCAYCKTNYKNATVHIGHVGSVRTNYTDMSTHINSSIPSYKKCSAFGAEYLTGSEIILHDPTLLENDLIHPNAAGVDAIARGITMCLLGGRAHINVKHNISAYTSGYFSGVSFNGVYEEVRDDNTYLRFTGGNNLTLTLASEGEIATMHEKIGTVTGGPLIIDGQNRISIPVNARCVYHGTVVDVPNASITIDANGDVIFNLLLINQSAPNATIIQLYQMGCANIATCEC